MRFFPLSAFAILVFGLAACSRPDPATYVLRNVNGYALQGDSLVRFDAIAVQDGQVLGYGTYESVRHHGFRDEDGGGRTLLPGLIDAHAHVMGLGQALMTVDLFNVPTKAEALERVAAFAAANPGDGWILGRGWNQVLWEGGEFPSAADLDAVVGDRPVLLERVDGHASWANTEAMRRAGITDATPDVVGGRILRDAAGRATGIFIDNSSNALYAQVPPADDASRTEALDRALAHIAAHGLTGVHDMGVDSTIWALYDRFGAEGRLTTRLRAYVGGVTREWGHFAGMGPRQDLHDGLLHLDGVKLYADGALGSRGAALLAPYSDDPGNRGLLFLTDAQVDTLYATVTRAGFPVAIHAIGDAANRQVLDGFQRLREAGAPPLRHRIEHAQVVSPQDLPRFRELGVIASMQPVHATSDRNMAEDRVGADRIRGAYAWRTLVEQGTLISAGSDFPVELVNPFLGLWAAVTRAGWYPEQALTRTEALYAFTVAAARAVGMEGRTGSLEPGARADFILIDRDYFTVPEAEIADIRVMETRVGGRVVYKAQP